jgi:hypothetical protein
MGKRKNNFEKGIEKYTKKVYIKNTENSRIILVL